MRALRIRIAGLAQAGCALHDSLQIMPGVNHGAGTYFSPRDTGSYEAYANMSWNWRTCLQLLPDQNQDDLENNE